MKACYKVQRSRANEITTPHTRKHEAKFEDTLVLVDELYEQDFEDECDAKGISYE